MLQTAILALSLSSDAFAASLIKGARFPGMPWARTTIIALGFGALEGLAPLIGYGVGRGFAGKVEDFDHWVAFAILGCLGAAMIWKSFCKPEEEAIAAAPCWSSVAMTALGTSVDAVAVGLTLALVSDNIPLTLLAISGVTFLMALIGLHIGGVVGNRAGVWVERLGGAGLIAIGANILITHLLGWA
jgi:putative Mn2+ efflux pump MntP